MPDDPRPRRPVLLAALGLLAAAAVGALTLLPIGWKLNRFIVWIYYDLIDVDRHFPGGWITVEGIAAFLNVLMMIPLALLARLVFERARWWWTAAAITAASACIELAQWTLPLGREGSVGDVLTNALGAVIGAAVAEWSLRRR